MANTPSVTDSTFDEVVLKSSQPVVVDFFAEWCGPCKAMAPTLDLVATENAGKMKVVKLDIDQNPVMTQKYGIQAVPTLIVFHNGKVKARQSGAIMQKKKLEDWVNGAIVA
jgi:thioredoxin 1